MLPYQRQQFDHLLQVATERFIERISQRLGGEAEALQRLRADQDGDGIGLAQFVNALFADFLLDNPEGAAFVLLALQRRPLPAATASGNIGAHLEELSRQAFQALLRSRAEEALEQRTAYQAVAPHGV